MRSVLFARRPKPLMMLATAPPKARAISSRSSCAPCANATARAPTTSAMTKKGTTRATPTSDINILAVTAFINSFSSSSLSLELSASQSASQLLLTPTLFTRPVPQLLNSSQTPCLYGVDRKQSVSSCRPELSITVGPTEGQAHHDPYETNCFEGLKPLSPPVVIRQ